MHERNWKLADEQAIFDMMRMWNNLDSVFEQLNKEQTRTFDMTVASSQWLREWKETPSPLVMVSCERQRHSEGIYNHGIRRTQGYRRAD